MEHIIGRRYLITLKTGAVKSKPDDLCPSGITVAEAIANVKANAKRQSAWAKKKFSALGYNRVK
jgi:hypothetical protein